MSQFSSTVRSISNTCHLTLISHAELHPGETLWLFGAIGRTQDWNQPVSRYTLDNRYIATITADVRNETSYNEPFAYFGNLDLSYHTLVVENTKEGATLFLDYYLVDPIPPDELSKSMGNLQTGGMPLTTSISENPELISGSGLSGDAATGNLTGAVVGGILVALLLAVVAIILWGRRANAKRSHYRSAAVYEVLCDGTREFPALTVMNRGSD